MDKGISNYIENFKSIDDLKKFKLNKKLIVFLIFIAISSVFWLLNALSGEYTTIIEHPIRYYNFPKDKVLVGNLPNYINIKVNAYGFSILKYKYKLRTSFDAIDFDVKQLGLRKISGSKSKYYILTRYEQAKISNQLDKEMTLLEIYPDTIYFDLANMVTKKILVVPNVDFKLDKQTMLNGDIRVKPDSILIYGPQTITDSVDSVFTNYQDFKLISNEITQNIGLKSIEGVTSETKKVSLTIPVENFTEITFKKIIEIKNLPDSIILKTFPKNIDISYQIALSNFDKISDNDFIVSVDFNDTKNALGNKLKVQMESFPIEANKVQYSPTHVEFIIEKK